MHHAAEVSRDLSWENARLAAATFTSYTGDALLSQAHAIQEKAAKATLTSQERDFLRDEAARLVQEAYACRLQSRWRVHAARLRVDRLRAQAALEGKLLLICI